MKIWVLTTDDGDGVTSEVFVTNDKATAAAKAWVETIWSDYRIDPCPTPFQMAYHLLCEQSGFLDQMALTEHDIRHHPAVSEARACLHQASRRLVVNNLAGEEDPFISDNDTALEMLG